ncbi:hypothetical protein RISK_000690 [Rhodopirellula islandica]|uniref:Uncharacterized protein n=1 Tax=Rhodopirellula islandica TaxID=595434 RepID=A0A0J1BMA0_RHOIS|nr:hypothetical protein RISK_000690 [Rhodopirellula islandica]
MHLRMAWFSLWCPGTLQGRPRGAKVDWQVLFDRDTSSDEIDGRLSQAY